MTSTKQTHSKTARFQKKMFCDFFKRGPMVKLKSMKKPLGKNKKRGLKIESKNKENI